jgi:streptomycin 6-kinase
VEIPRALKDEWSREAEWLAELPRLAGECAECWGLELEQPVDTPHSLVVPAGDVVLKLNAPPHFEADHEADALELWDGNGAARLVGRDDERRALLIERCRPGTCLWDTDAEARAVVGVLLPRLLLELAEPHPFRRLADEAARWAQEVPRRYELAGAPFERSLLDYAVDVFRTAEPTAAFLVNQDLHGGNVLRAEREAWLVIDPKPLVGEREVDGVGLLRNAAWEDRREIRLWLAALAELGLDEGRLRGWGVAHALAWGWDERDGWSEASIDAARAIRTA